jgi:hypothetical protein
VDQIGWGLRPAAFTDDRRRLDDALRLHRADDRLDAVSTLIEEPKLPMPFPALKERLLGRISPPTATFDPQVSNTLGKPSTITGHPKSNPNLELRAFAHRDERD